MRGWFVPGFWPTTKIRSACSKSSSGRALADADRLAQRDAARLVAHVRAVGQVVRAERAHEELVEERRLVARAARRVERRLVRDVEAAQLARRSARTRRPRRSARSGRRPARACIGSVRRPCWPSQKSDCGRAGRRPSARAKNAAVDARAVVASSATAFAPFSQNSSMLRGRAGSGHAQPGQSKPSSWFTSASVRAVRTGPIARSPCRIAHQTDVGPAAARSGGCTSRRVSSAIPRSSSRSMGARIRSPVRAARARRAGATDVVSGSALGGAVRCRA